MRLMMFALNCNEFKDILPEYNPKDPKSINPIWPPTKGNLSFYLAYINDVVS